MQEVKIQFYNFRIDDGFQKLDSINPYELEKEFNLKTIIFDVKQKFNIEYIDSPECVFIFFSHSILDVSRSLHRFALFNEITLNKCSVFAHTIILSGLHVNFSNLRACNITFTKIVCVLSKLIIFSI